MKSRSRRAAIEIFRMKSLRTKRWFLPALVAALVVLAAIPAAFAYTRYTAAQKTAASPQQAQAQEINDLLASVSKLVELPPNEVPTVATVSDREKLQNQAFFQNAQNGDKVLIFTSARKAILYRPGSGKIVEIAPVNISSVSATPQPAAEASPSLTNVRVALRNGTSVSGLTRRYETTLLDTIQNIAVTEKENASKTDYSESLLIDVAGNAARAQAFAAQLGLKVSPLPEGEPKPDADLLIILGSDKATQ